MAAVSHRDDQCRIGQRFNAKEEISRYLASISTKPSGASFLLIFSVRCLYGVGP